MGLSRVLNLLPAPAEHLLRTKEKLEHLAGDSGGAGEYDTFADVTTEEARAFAETFENAAFAGGPDDYGLVYWNESGTLPEQSLFIRLEPILPHGEAYCSPCH
jgi:hypothetical protein